MRGHGIANAKSKTSRSSGCDRMAIARQAPHHPGQRAQPVGSLRHRRRSGIVVLVPDYRAHLRVSFPALVEDGSAVVRWALDNIAGVADGTRPLFLTGHSAGAMTVVHRGEERRQALLVERVYRAGPGGAVSEKNEGAPTGSAPNPRRSLRESNQPPDAPLRSGRPANCSGTRPRGHRASGRTCPRRNCLAADTPPAAKRRNPRRGP